MKHALFHDAIMARMELDKLSPRLRAFRALVKDAWFHKAFAKLKAEEVAFCENFIREHDHLDKGAFEKSANRLGMDRGLSSREMSRLNRQWDLLLTANIRGGK